MKNRKGVTIAEVIICVSIVLLLAAILTPVLANAKKDAKRVGAATNLRQLYNVLQIYRADYNGSDVSYNSTYAMGLPPSDYYLFEWVTKDAAIFKSPCGPNEEFLEQALVNLDGYSTYSAGYCDDKFQASDTTNSWLKDHIRNYQENAVVFHDVWCNDPGTKMSSPYVSKRIISILMSGQLLNKMRTGHMSYLETYSGPRPQH